MSTRGRPRAFDHDEAIRLRSGGMPVREIAERLGVSETAIRLAIDPAFRHRQYAIRDRCIDAQRQPCKGGCGRRVWMHERTRTPSGFCPQCLGPVRNVVRHGTETEYSQGCRCDECRAAATEARRRRRQAKSSVSRPREGEAVQPTRRAEPSNA